MLELIYGPQIRVKRKLQTEFKVRTIEADAFLESEIVEFEAEDEGENLIYHIEAQSTYDPLMPDRLLRYAQAAHSEHGLNVCSCVIYLRDIGTVQEPPHRWQRKNGKNLLVFDYTSVELAKMPLEDLKQAGRLSLWPLLVLSKGGASHAVMREVVTELAQARKANLLFVTKLFADLVFTEEEDQQWLERIFAMHRDPLSQTPTYQKILKEGREEGREEGLEEGLEKGREEGLQEGLEKGELVGLQRAVLTVVESRFPPLAELARQQVMQVRKPETINYALKALAKAPDEEVARMLLELLAA